MGMDFSSNYRIGYEVEASDEILEDEEFQEELECGVGEYLNNSDISVGFEYFDENEGYDTATIATYLIISEPFKDGLDLTAAKAKLDAEVKRLKLEVVG